VSTHHIVHVVAVRRAFIEVLPKNRTSE
jgi:hypothetical protein